MGNRLGIKYLQEFGPCRLNWKGGTCPEGKETVQLPAKALEILSVLVQRCGSVVSKDDLMQVVWPNTFVEEANIGFV
jgi:DNA-binding winged helix-turn-helix (wHTH) protein